EPVSHIMTKDVFTLNHTNSLNDAEKLFAEHEVRHLPVVSGDDLIGMLSLTDLQRISFVDNYGDGENKVDTVVYDMLTIEQVMVSDPVSVDSSTTIKDVASILAKKEFHALPVVDNNKLVGIVTTTDLINFLLEQY
ncbi:MAG: CBS domain-containing protein, partial [Bacteroidota bacterium]